jgi:hypothetical protein
MNLGSNESGIENFDLITLHIYVKAQKTYSWRTDHIEMIIIKGETEQRNPELLSGNS